jgi:hypothetical protein
VPAVCTKNGLPTTKPCALLVSAVTIGVATDVITTANVTREAKPVRPTENEGCGDGAVVN